MGLDTILWLQRAVAARMAQLDPRREQAIRLFNGFYEGCAGLVIDLYARTLVVQNHADDPSALAGQVQASIDFLSGQFPWIRAIILKSRNGAPDERRGKLVFGERADDWVREHGVRYAIDLFINQDNSLYLDTRHLRAWAIENLSGKTVLNTFAYTGSLGVAALAGGAQRVVQMDRNRTFLNLARRSYSLNGFAIDPGDFLVGDFYLQVSWLKHAGVNFDCVFLDPPFFAVNARGTIDLQHQSHRLINKVRPLINHQGYLVTVNNALYLSGQEYYRALQALCADGYLSIESLIPVPEDFTGAAQAGVQIAPVLPAPFNHSTKIAVLRVRRKDNASGLLG